ncbi:hypothetical protein CNR22_17840 [Sphingobacteriaceae bacterium]|nr:hypothetical protein CNR22_17840 [Sphingobacteriaceae bacterium]
MKTYTSISFLSLTLTLLLSGSFISCKKTVVGPAGEQGVAGVQGETGAQGNANVKAISFSTGSNWKTDSTAKNFNYTYHTVSLTKEVVDNGFVMLYMSEELGTNGSEWKAIPFSTTELNVTFKYALSEVEVFITSSTGKMPTKPTSLKFKLVIVPPGE